MDHNTTQASRTQPFLDQWECVDEGFEVPDMKRVTENKNSTQRTSKIHCKMQPVDVITELRIK